MDVSGLCVRNLVTSIYDSSTNCKPSKITVPIKPEGTKITVRRLLDKVTAKIHELKAEEPDWTIDELESISEAFHSKERTISGRHTGEHIVRAVVVIFLTFEVLRRWWGQLTTEDRDIITESLTRSIIGIKLRDRVKAALDREYEIMSALDADMNSLHALWILSDLLMEIPETSEEERAESILETSEESGEEQSDSKLSGHLPLLGLDLSSPYYQKEPLISPSTGSESTLSSRTISPSFMPYYNDVQAQYFLKPACALEIDCVKSVNVQDETLIVETRLGLRVKVEEGVTVSDISGKYNAVTIRALSASGYDLSATVIIPPRSMYSFSDVVQIDDDTAIPDWTQVETTAATVWIGNGPYNIQRCEVANRIMVKNTYH